MGASHNLSPMINVNVKKITNKLVGLLNKIGATTTKEGSVILNGGLQFDNVIFVP